MRTALLALIAAMASIAALAQGMTCSPETIRGNWGVTRDGYLTPAPNAPLAPTKILGACKSPDGVNFVCEAAASIGGTVVKQEMNGAAITASEACPASSPAATGVRSAMDSSVSSSERRASGGSELIERTRERLERAHDRHARRVRAPASRGFGDLLVAVAELEPQQHGLLYRVGQSGKRALVALERLASRDLFDDRPARVRKEVRRPRRISPRQARRRRVGSAETAVRALRDDHLWGSGQRQFVFARQHGFQRGFQREAALRVHLCASAADSWRTCTHGTDMALTMMRAPSGKTPTICTWPRITP